MERLASEQGFSLLELLVAIAILSMAAIPMLAVQTTTLQSSTILKEKNLARMIAENKLTEFKVSELLPQPGRHTGTDSQADVTFDWYANIEHIANQNLISISLYVQQHDSKKTVYKITGFRKMS